MTNRYSHDNWNQVWDLPPSVDRDRQLRLVGRMAKGNLHWFVRRLIGGISEDEREWVKQKIVTGEIIEQSDFLRYMKRLHEDNFR